MTSVASPLYIDSVDVVRRLYRSKLNSLYFITIKDNSQSSRWTKIGKISDWLRRSCSNFIVVKGTQGGIHFHALCSKSPDKTFRMQKGIHFHVKHLDTLRSSVVGVDESYLERSERIDMAKYIRNSTFEYVASELDPDSQCIIRSIANMIREYWDRKHRNQSSRIRRQKKKTKTMFVVDNCISYLQKNLDEPRDDTIRKYSDYVCF